MRPAWHRVAAAPNLVRVYGLGEVSRRQEGIVTRQQALSGGMAVAQIRARLKSGRWRSLYPGVYATFTGVVPWEAQLWAAVLAAGAGAVLSHQTAAAVAGFGSGETDRKGAIHVTVPAGRRTRLPGIVVHRSAQVDAARHPTQTPPQTRVEETVLDLWQSSPDLGRALDWVTRACSGRLTTVGRLKAAVARRKKIRWRMELLAALDDVRSGSHSALESRYLHRVERRHGLPAGRRQQPRSRPGGRWYDDVRYSAYGISVELDGLVAHPEYMRRQEKKRDNAEVVAGGRVLHYDWAEVTESPCAVAADVATVLRRNGWPGVPKPCGPQCTILDRGV